MRARFATLRAWFKRWLRIAKAVSTDQRLPWPVRWLFRAALAIKCVPLPDFGIDEVLLLIGVGLLAGPYRGVWNAIREENR